MSHYVRFRPEAESDDQPTGNWCERCGVDIDGLEPHARWMVGKTEAPRCGYWGCRHERADVAAVREFWRRQAKLYRTIYDLPA